MTTKPVLIIGAGVVGLTLAHGLKKAGIPFQIYERDAHIHSRGQGWAITLHWALPLLREILSPETLQLVDATQVDPEIGRNDTGHFVFINLETLEPKFRIPPNERRRVNREKLRGALLQDVSGHVHWGKRLLAVEETPDGVVASFTDGSKVEGAIVVGAEGSNSQTRRYLAPTTYKNEKLPVRFVGSAVDFTEEEVKPIREVDPLLFQGCHPISGNFLWVSMLDVPFTNGSETPKNSKYRVQINMSWPVRTSSDEVKQTDAERLADMKMRAQNFHPMLRDIVLSIAEGTDVTEIVLQDWPCLEWNSLHGRVTLAGDAAHAMTMYRGEAANHGILDAFKLWQALDGVYNRGSDLKSSIDMYEAEMRDRTSTAVLLSRQACLDAHDWANLNENSAVLKRRAVSGV